MTKPTDDGRKLHFPMSLLCSIAGSSKLKNEAATITPDANPRRARSVFSPIAFFKKNTQPAPSAVPRNGIMIIPKMPNRSIHT